MLPTPESEEAKAAAEKLLSLFDHQPSKSSGEKETSSQENEVPPSPLLAEELLLQAPTRKKARIWPWIIAMLVAIAGTGFWLNHETWLEHPWLRSQLIRLHLSADIRDSDWLVKPGSLHAEWLTRSDHSQVLVIQGDVRNRLHCPLPPPMIQIQFFAPGRPEEPIGEQTVTITQPPTMDAIRSAPYAKPADDTLPIPGLTERGFILVLESVPENLGDFTLKAAVKK